MVTRFIYTLIDPRTDVPFYVGQTINIQKRLIRHLSDSAQDAYPHHKRILEITAAGKTPIIEIIDQVQYDPSAMQAADIVYEREKYWVDYYSKDYELCNTEYNQNAVKIQRECLYCNDFYTPNKPKQKFCSDKCRVYYNRKNPKKPVAQEVSTVQMQVLYNAVLDLVAKAGQTPTPSGISPKTAITAQISTPLPQLNAQVIMHKYVEDRRMVTCEEEFKTWSDQLQADNRLSTKQKQEVINSR